VWIETASSYEESNYYGVFEKEEINAFENLSGK